MEATEGASEEVEVVGWVESGLVEVSVDICWNMNGDLKLRLRWFFWVWLSFVFKVDKQVFEG